MPATKKPGRPPRKPAEKQSSGLSVRYTPGERLALERMHRAERPDLSLAAFVKKKSLE